MKSTLLFLLALLIEPKVERAGYNLFSDQDELVLGRKFAADTERQVILLKDAALKDYLDKVVTRLGSQTQRPALKYHLQVVDSPQINAFSLPGGYIYIYRGLLSMAWNEGELAGMLAHEISHVVARHNMNRLSRHSIAADLAKRTHLQGPQVKLTEAEVRGWEGAFSRSEETEADLLAFYTMLRAGWHPSCLISAFDGIGAFTGDRQLIANLLVTHPAAAERSRYLSEELLYANPPETLARDSAAFQLMKRLLNELPPPKGK